MSSPSSSTSASASPADANQSTSSAASTTSPADSSSSASTTSPADADQEEDVDILGLDDGDAHEGHKKLRLNICGLDGGDYAAAESFFGNACLDLFLLDADAPPQRLRHLLAAAWDQDALTAIKLVSHRRAVKRDTEGFFAAINWMLEAHPRVLVDNLPAFADLGYVQDFVNILDHLVVVADNDRRREADTNVNLQPAHAGAGLKRARDGDPAPTSPPGTSVPTVPKRARQQDPAGAGANAHPSAALLDVADSAPIHLQAAATVHPLYDTLYRAMSDYFVDRLRADMGHLNNGDMSKITRAADQCNAMASLFEQTTLLRLDIARRLLPNPNQEPEPDQLLLYGLHQSVFFPLSFAAEMEKPERPKVRDETILPHSIAAGFAKQVWKTKSLEKRGEITRKWYSMVDDLRGKGCLKNCVAVCDVSLDSLGSTKLLEVCVGLGLLITELSEAPWKNSVHAFSEGESAHPLRGETSYPDKVEAIRNLKCNDRFNLRRVFEWVLHEAARCTNGERDMVKTIFVITGKDFEHAIVPPASIVRPEDMEPDDFDPQHVRRWCDDYRIVCEKFEEHGYGGRVPGVVFWNLRGDRSAALTASTDVHDGVLSLSGYSDTLLRLVLYNDGVVHPDDEMTDAIAGEKYKNFKV